jgi:hypothetical protein
MKIEAAGLDMGELPEGSVPLMAVTCMKIMLPDGVIIRVVRAAGDVDNVEALGMVHHARLLLEDGVMGRD